jgi:hypothetical protein
MGRAETDEGLPAPGVARHRGHAKRSSTVVTGRGSRPCATYVHCASSGADAQST